MDRPALGGSSADLRATLGAFGGVDAIVHLAAAGVSPKHATKDLLQAVNEKLPERLVAAAAKVGVGRIVMAGTAAEYGESADDFDHIPPTAPLRPTSHYGRSKAVGFQRSVAAAHEHALPLDYLRIFNAFGEGQHRNALWPALRNAAKTGSDLKMSLGTHIRDFVDVAAVADAFVVAVLARNRDAIPTVKNVGTGHGTTVREFSTYWWRRWQAQGKLIFGALPERLSEPQRLVSDGGEPACLDGPVSVF